jgi:hypothetical protein
MDISCKTMNIRLVADASFTEKQLKIYVLKTEFHLMNLKYYKMLTLKPNADVFRRCVHLKHKTGYLTTCSPSSSTEQSFSRS